MNGSGIIDKKQTLIVVVKSFKLVVIKYDVGLEGVYGTNGSKYMLFLNLQIYVLNILFAITFRRGPRFVFKPSNTDLLF